MAIAQCGELPAPLTGGLEQAHAHTGLAAGSAAGRAVTDRAGPQQGGHERKQQLGSEQA
jgi:hypothetical protein